MTPNGLLLGVGYALVLIGSYSKGWKQCHKTYVGGIIDHQYEVLARSLEIDVGPGVPHFKSGSSVRIDRWCDDMAMQRLYGVAMEIRCVDSTKGLKRSWSPDAGMIHYPPNGIAYTKKRPVDGRFLGEEPLSAKIWQISLFGLVHKNCIRICMDNVAIVMLNFPTGKKVGKLKQPTPFYFLHPFPGPTLCL